MKKIVIIIIAFAIGCKQPKPEQTSLEGREIPAFKVLLTDSVTQFNTKNIAKGKPTVFFYINPHCPFCKAEMEDIVKNMGSMKEIQFYVLSPFPLHQIKQFSDHFNLSNYSNITTGCDYDRYFLNYFRVKGVPYTAVYGGDNKLRSAYSGKITSDFIKTIAETTK